MHAFGDPQYQVLILLSSGITKHHLPEVVFSTFYPKLALLWLLKISSIDSVKVQTQSIQTARP